MENESGRDPEIPWAEVVDAILHRTAPLPSKLAQVMVGVQVTPAKPLLPAHGTEERMRRRKGGSVAKTAHDRKQLRAVSFEFGWRRSAHALLHLGARGDAVRPFQRQL